MNRFLATILCLFSFSLLHARQGAGFTISHLSGPSYIYTTWQKLSGIPFPANGMYIVTAKGIVIIDSPWDTTQVAPIIDSIEHHHQRKVIAAIATHFHEDRTGAFDIFRRRGIATYSSCRTLALCKEHHEPEAQNCFAGDTAFDFGDIHLRTFYPGAGHAPDNIVIWCEEGHILYGGCLIKSTQATDIGNLSDANLAAWPATMQRLHERYPHPGYIIPGHQSWSSLRAIKHTRKLIKKATKHLRHTLA